LYQFLTCITRRPSPAECPAPFDHERSIQEFSRENAAVQSLCSRQVRKRPYLHQVEPLIWISLPNDYLRIADALEILRCNEIPSLRRELRISVTRNGSQRSHVRKCEYPLNACGAAVVPRYQMREISRSAATLACTRINRNRRAGPGNADDAKHPSDSKDHYEDEEDRGRSAQHRSHAVVNITFLSGRGCCGVHPRRQQDYARKQCK